MRRSSSSIALEESDKEEEQTAIVIQKVDEGILPPRRPSYCQRLSVPVCFIIKNILTLSAGFVGAMGVRAIIGKQSNIDPRIIKANNGAQLYLSDILSCIVILLLCHFWIKPLKTRCSSTGYSRKLLLKILLRDCLPLIISFGSLFLVKFIDIEINKTDHVVHGPEHSRLFEVSDVVSGVVLLFFFHFVDYLLERKWHSDPRNLMSSHNETRQLSRKNPSVQSSYGTFLYNDDLRVSKHVKEIIKTAYVDGLESLSNEKQVDAATIKERYIIELAIEVLKNLVQHFDSNPSQVKSRGDKKLLDTLKLQLTVKDAMLSNILRSLRNELDTFKLVSINNNYVFEMFTVAVALIESKNYNLNLLQSSEQATLRFKKQWNEERVIQEKLIRANEDEIDSESDEIISSTQDDSEIGLNVLSI